MKRTLVCLLAAALLLLCACGAQNEARQAETSGAQDMTQTQPADGLAQDAAQDEAQDAALCGSLEELLQTEFWSMTGEELAALLDPQAWTVYEGESLSQTRWVGTAFGLPVWLRIETKQDGTVNALSVSQTFYSTALAPDVEAKLAGLEEGAWDELRVSSAAEAFPPVLAQWTLAARDMLARCGAELNSDPRIELHGGTQQELETMFRATLADSMERGKGGTASFSYQEAYYYAPEGWAADIRSTVQAWADADSGDAQLTRAWNTLCIYAPDYQSASGVSPLEYTQIEDPYLYYADMVNGYEIPDFSEAAETAERVTLTLGQPHKASEATLVRETDAGQIDALAQAAQDALGVCEPLKHYSSAAGQWSWTAEFRQGEQLLLSVQLIVAHESGWIVAFHTGAEQTRYYCWAEHENPPEEIVELARILHTLAPAEDEYWIGEVLGLDP